MTSTMGFFSSFKKRVAERPHSIALLDLNGRKFTYQEFSLYIGQAQVWLKQFELNPGDKIISVLPNSIETAALFFASMFSGYVYAPLPCTSTVHEISRWGGLINAKLCFLVASVSSEFTLSLKRNLQCQLRVIHCNSELFKSKGGGQDSFSNDVGQLLIASSGTTGEPKAMLLSPDTLWNAAEAFLQYHGVNESDIRFWNYLPMFYLGGLFNLLLIPLAAGGSVLIDETFSGKTFLTFWSVVEQFNVNALWLIPTIIRGLTDIAARLGNHTRAYPKIDYCYLGTAPISVQEKERCTEIFGLKTLENYGLSETTFISSERDADWSLRESGDVGNLMPQVQVKLKPLNGKEDDMQQIWVRTPFMMQGYLDQHGFHLPSYDAEGYWNTGDLGCLNNGHLKLLGRERDVIKKGGVLIALREIESLAALFPGVAEVVAIQVSHAFYGEAYELRVRVLDSVTCQDIFIEALKTFLFERLSRHKWPEDILVVDAFPRTQTGKVQKHKLCV